MNFRELLILYMRIIKVISRLFSPSANAEILWIRKFFIISFVNNWPISLLDLSRWFLVKILFSILHSFLISSEFNWLKLSSQIVLFKFKMINQMILLFLSIYREFLLPDWVHCEYLKLKGSSFDTNLF